MNIRIGTFSKEINSTKQTGAGFGTVVSVHLKEPCSLTAPVIELHDDVWKPEYNYIYIPKWGRYYFLHDPVMSPGLIWSVQCAVDVLASWRSYIRSSTAYVRRSASNYSLFIPDPTWSHTSTPTVSRKSLDTFTSPFDHDGCFALFVASSKAPSSTDAVPAMSVYLLTAEDLGKLVRYMFSADFFNTATAGADTTSAALAQTFFNPFQYVIKCMWLPFPYSFIWGSASTITFGWWECPSTIVTAKKVQFHSYEISFTFTYGNYDDWTDRSPEWASYMLYFPGFGEIPLNPSHAGQTISGKVAFDFATGNASMFLSAQNGALLQSARGRLAADVQLSSLYEDLVQDVTSISGLVRAGVGALGNIVSGQMNDTGRKGLKLGAGLLGGPIGGAVGAVISGGVDLSGGIGGLAEAAVKGAASALQPSVTTVGTAGDRTTLDTNLSAYVTTVKYKRLQDDHTTLGGMCCRTLSLSGLSGYTEVVNPHIEAPATSGELTMINGFLSGGFYME